MKVFKIIQCCILVQYFKSYDLIIYISSIGITDWGGMLKLFCPKRGSTYVDIM